jgi:predicted metal-dependent phosphoesterase TrpH
MAIYKIDTHVHTSETSFCGNVRGIELVRLYKNSGYYGVIITDHYCKEFFESLGKKNWEEKVDRFLTGYRNAFNEGKKIGINVFLGMEIRFTENWNDYLVYGFSEDFLKEYKELYNLGLKKFRKFTQGKGILIFQAHPFRQGMTRANLLLLDGVEVFNGHPRQNSYNHLAYSFAKKNNLIMISGSDFHRAEDLATGGIIIPKAAGSSKELTKLMQEKRIIGLYKAGQSSTG